MEQNLKREKEHLNTLCINHSVLNNAIYLLQHAHHTIAIARRELDHSLDMNTFDLFSHSAFAEIAESSHLAKARNAAAQSQRFINEAKRVYPKILDIGDLHVNQNNLVFNIMFDNIWTDMSMRKMIHEASNRISRADTLLVNILAGMKAKLQECEADRDKTNEVVKQLMAKHFSTRITMVKNIIGPPPPYSS
ncbi:unnamed protein product [Rotaria socialis]|uniref:Uncharacterized protein n=1 Tax=Rotaria socialis TaxID=392032 RepID=A0A818KLV7_9BILA|nr:unnamed protein product [Rotaria socialis]